MKKNVNKNVCKNNNGTVKVIKIDREHMQDQILEVLAALDKDLNNKTEYKMIISDLTEQEVIEFDRIMLRIVELKSRMSGSGYRVGAEYLPFLA